MEKIKFLATVNRLVLVLGTCVLHCLTVGFATSIGVFYIKFLEEFNYNRGTTAWIGSINFAVLMLTCPVGSWISTKYGCSTCMFIGGILSVVGLVVSAFSPSFLLLFFTFGVLVGFGFGLVFSPCIIIVNLLIKEWRSLSNGVSMCGLSLGTTLHPMLCNFLIKNYGWRNTILIMASVCLHICLLSQLIWIAEWNLNRFSKIEERKSKMELQEPRKPSLVFETLEVATINDVEYRLSISSMSNEKILGININEKDIMPQSFWKIPMYWGLHFNTFLFCFSQSVILTHLAAFATTTGQSLEQASSQISAFGFSGIVGRIVLSLVAQSSKVNTSALFAASYNICGISTICYSAYGNYIYMLTTSTFIGFFLSAAGPVYNEVIHETVYTENFAHAYGFLMISAAFGTVLGAPCAGWLYDFTLQYETSFYLGGASFIISTFPFAVLFFFKFHHM